MTTHPEVDPEIEANTVETYYRDGLWHTRRGDCEYPFASGAGRERLIAVGVEVARWNGARHLIRDTDGTMLEDNTYVTGPYPSRSPAARQRFVVIDVSP